MKRQTIVQQQKSTPPTFLPVSNGVLQRKCACGQHTVAGGECSECRRKRLQRKDTGRTGPETIPSIVHEVLHSPGQPLDPATRAFMESRFSHDFSQVQIYTDTKAAESAQAVNALAYTVGKNVVFGTGQYAPRTGGGKRLLAHELTHVVQQAKHRNGESDLTLGQVNSSQEREAESNSARLDDTVVTGEGIDTAQGLTPVQSGVLQKLSPAGAAAAGAAAGLVLGAVTFAAALAYAKSLSTRYPGWLTVLPNCPCTAAAARRDTATWEPDANPILGYFHPGAASSFRSKSTFSSIPGTAHGQQCTYDSSGNLITDGPGAGTPDVWSPNASTADHFLHDVTTWQVLGWRIYSRYWRPNNGNSCNPNMGDNTLGRRISEFLS